MLSPRSSIISTQNQYSTVTKPAALTGSWADPCRSWRRTLSWYFCKCPKQNKHTNSYPCVIWFSGTLDVRLMGCQDLLENVPGRSKAASVPLPGWSPSETRSSFISRANRNRGVSSRNLTKSEELSSKWPLATSVELNYRNAECVSVCSDEISAVLKLDNTVVGQTSWKPVSNQAWDQKFTLELDRVKNAHILGWKPVLLSLDDGMLHECLWVCVCAVSWAGDLCVLAWLALALCCQVSAAGGLPGQPATWDVSVSRASGNAVCWGTQMRNRS